MHAAVRGGDARRRVADGVEALLELRVAGQKRDVAGGADGEAIAGTRTARARTAGTTGTTGTSARRRRRRQPTVRGRRRKHAAVAATTRMIAVAGTAIGRRVAQVGDAVGALDEVVGRGEQEPLQRVDIPWRPIDLGIEQL